MQIQYWKQVIQRQLAAPAFHNISWKTFIIFGVLCFGAAVQAFLFYSETAQKSLEEIELLFSKGGPKPWNTKPGDSLLDAKIAQVAESQQKGPWALLLVYDLLLWIFRSIFYVIPYVGGRARGKKRPRAPSLSERPSGRARTFSIGGTQFAGTEASETEGLKERILDTTLKDDPADEYGRD
ncbi:MAG: hypothetical protein Q9199_001372 [Rusavskia elegans]